MPFDVKRFAKTAGNRFRCTLALALLVAAVTAAAATQGRIGDGSTASIGIRFVVAPAIHGRTMSLSTQGGAVAPSSSAHYLCLTVIDIADVTLGTPAPGGSVSRLTPVEFERTQHSRCAGQTLVLQWPSNRPAATGRPALLVIAPI